MAQVKDSVGNVLEAGDWVEMPDPSDSDGYNFSFAGTLDGFREVGDTTYAQVRDSDGDVFDMEPERLTLISE